MGFDILWGETLPCMPSVLLNALDACLDEPVDIDQAVYWIKQDAVIAAHLYDLLCVDTRACAHTSLLHDSPERSLEQCIERAGVEQLRAFLLQLATRQISVRFDQADWAVFKKQWRRSLLSARIGKALALLTGYPDTGECYQVALMHNIGQLIQHVRYREAYQSVLDAASDDKILVKLERERLADDHGQVAAQLLVARGWPVAHTDAIRFHHEPLNDVRDAQHLVKVVNIASLLSDESFTARDEQLSEIESMLGIKKPLLLELLSQLQQEVETLSADLSSASSTAVAALADQPGSSQEAAGETAVVSDARKADWQLDLASQQQLALRVADHILCQRLVNTVLASNNEREMLDKWRQALCDLYQSPRGILFLYEGKGNQLQFHADETEKLVFSITVEAGRSLASDVYLGAGPLFYSAEEKSEQRITVVDRQIAHYLGNQAVGYLPLFVHGQCVGVAALAISEQSLLRLRSQSQRMLAFVSMVCAAVPVVRQRLDSDIQGRFLYQQQFQKRIREALHEVNNPLAIVSNYLQTIRFKRPEDDEIQADISKISTELTRASTLLEKLKVPLEGNKEESLADVGEIIRDTSELIREGLLDDKGIALHIDVDNGLEGFQARQLPLQQILTNLLKNAAEVLSPGGKIEVVAKTMRSGEQHQYLGLEVIDNGAGLPVEVQQRLFQSVASTKSGHAGLGLQIVKRLVEDLNGMIFCRTSSAGTQFQILIPVINPPLQVGEETDFGKQHG
jgi:signal transduction histidine kinase/HD-like signal output (HDOD) protein